MACRGRRFDPGWLHSLGEFAEGGDLAPLCQPLQRPSLDLPNALAGQAERAADLLE